MCVCVTTPFLNHPAKGFPQREQSTAQKLSLSCVFFFFFLFPAHLGDAEQQGALASSYESTFAGIFFPPLLVLTTAKKIPSCVQSTSSRGTGEKPSKHQLGLSRKRALGFSLELTQWD